MGPLPLMPAMALPLGLFCGGSCRPHPPLTLRRLGIMLATLALNPDGFALALQRLRSMLATLALNLNAFAFTLPPLSASKHPTLLRRVGYLLAGRRPLAARCARRSSRWGVCIMLATLALNKHPTARAARSNSAAARSCCDYRAIAATKSSCRRLQVAFMAAGRLWPLAAAT